jgi:hypothetical protein
MKNWISTYPHEIIASVMLLDGKIYNYRIGEHPIGDQPFGKLIRVKISEEEMEKEKLMEIETIAFEVNNVNEHRDIFNVIAREWFKTWEIHEDLVGNRPYRD